MHNDSLFAVATDFSRHNSHKMRHSALTLEVSFQERDDSYPKLSKSTFYLNDLPILDYLWYFPTICDLNTLHLISIISPNSKNIFLERSPPSSSLREEVKKTCKFRRDNLSWFLTWPSWKSPGLDPEHYFGLLEKISQLILVFIREKAGAPPWIYENFGDTWVRKFILILLHRFFLSNFEELKYCAEELLSSFSSILPWDDKSCSILLNDWTRQ